MFHFAGLDLNIGLCEIRVKERHNDSLTAFVCLFVHLVFGISYFSRGQNPEVALLVLKGVFGERGRGRKPVGPNGQRSDLLPNLKSLGIDPKGAAKPAVDRTLPSKSTS